MKNDDFDKKGDIEKLPQLFAEFLKFNFSNKIVNLDFFILQI